MMSACTFTGHRPQKLYGFNESNPRYAVLKNKLKEEIEYQITHNRVWHFITGMALGIDTFAAEIVLELQHKYPLITLEAAIPCRTQPDKWPAYAQKRWRSIVDKCDKVTVLQETYTPDCLNKRNKYMIDNSDFIIAVSNGASGGTQHAINYARKNGLDITIINPDML